MIRSKVIVPLNELLQQNESALLNEFEKISVSGFTKEEFNKLYGELFPTLQAWKSGDISDEVFYDAVFAILDPIFTEEYDKDRVLNWFKDAWQQMNPTWEQFSFRLNVFRSLIDMLGIDIIFVSYTNSADINRFISELIEMSLFDSEHRCFHDIDDAGNLKSVMGMPVYCSHILHKKSIDEIIAHVISLDNNQSCSPLVANSAFTTREEIAYYFINSLSEKIMGQDLVESIRSLGVRMFIGELDHMNICNSFSTALQTSHDLNHMI